MKLFGKRFELYLGLIALAFLGAGCVLVLTPFASALLWAVVLCFTLWPVYETLLKMVGGRRTLAAFLITLGITLIVLLPFVIAGMTLADNVRELTTATRAWIEGGPPEPPAWLGRVPFFGDSASAYWMEFARDGAKSRDALRTFIEPASGRLLKIGLALGRGLFELTVSVLVSFFLFRDGATGAERLKTALSRIAGDRGRTLLDVAGKTVRGVVYGIIGTALVQAVVAGIGFAIAGVPAPGLLTLLMFFVAIIPFGAPFVWFPAALWLFLEGHPGWGVFMLIWGTGVSSVDNLVKPWLISQGSRLPFLLIFLGVLGGAVAFGFIGVFLGPTLLAVGYRLIKEWIATAPRIGIETGLRTDADAGVPGADDAEPESP
ncbi:MAG TPA: AI-2E family transporter [Verrucomicrobiota bacterium]|nr:AI-2E family transporter [Verrucomicrobiota bacterium]HRZ35790.1 AI-2E family transporter [Candidatus Paceibacterota bacterium]